MHLPSKFHRIISHLFPVYDKTEYPDHSALIIHQILLHVVSTLGLRLAVAGEVSLVTVQHGTVEYCWTILHNETISGLLRELWQLR